MKYGNISLKVLVAWLCRNYRFTTDLKYEDLKFQMDITLKLLNKHMVHVHKRERFWSRLNNRKNETFQSLAK